jgi:hypothetical protein
MAFVRAAVLAAVVLAFFGFNWNLHTSGNAALIWQRTTGDQWTKVCTFYTPIRFYERLIPLSADCPWTMVAQS